MNITTNELLMLLGEKCAEAYVLRRESAALEKRMAELEKANTEKEPKP